MWNVLSQTWRHFFKDECPRLAASLAYYTFFSLPALLVAIVFIGGLVADKATVAERMRDHFEETIGRAGAEQLTAILQNASQPQKSWLGWLIGTGMLLLGASGALMELQTALNRAWRVAPNPSHGGVRRLVAKRLLSLALLASIALLLLSSLAISWSLKAFGVWIDEQQWSWLPSPTLTVLHSAASLVVITLLFAALLKFLPDAPVAWSDVWIGAAATALLFWIGQWLLGMYLTWSRPTNAYGAAGSLALVLLWMYFSGIIFFLGAEFTKSLQERRGARR